MDGAKSFHVKVGDDAKMVGESYSNIVHPGEKQCPLIRDVEQNCIAHNKNIENAATKSNVQ